MEKTEHKNEKSRGRYEVIAKYFLLTMLLSFLGWAFETALMLFMTGRFHDQGFMKMPFCPIYGCSLMATYFLIGTPDERRGLLKGAEATIPRYAVYFAVAFLAPTVAELAVGFFFDTRYGIRLWSYDYLPYNFRGYISLPVSLGWAFLIFIFMKYFFPPLKKGVFKLPKGFASITASLLFIAVLLDMALSFRGI